MDTNTDQDQDSGVMVIARAYRPPPAVQTMARPGPSGASRRQPATTSATPRASQQIRRKLARCWGQKTNSAQENKQRDRSWRRGVLNNASTSRAPRAGAREKLEFERNFCFCRVFQPYRLGLRPLGRSRLLRPGKSLQTPRP